MTIKSVRLSFKGRVERTSATGTVAAVEPAQPVINAVAEPEQAEETENPADEDGLHWFVDQLNYVGEPFFTELDDDDISVGSRWLKTELDLRIGSLLDTATDQLESTVVFEATVWVGVEPDELLPQLAESGVPERHGSALNGKEVRLAPHKTIKLVGTYAFNRLTGLRVVDEVAPLDATMGLITEMLSPFRFAGREVELAVVLKAASVGDAGTGG